MRLTFKLRLCNPFRELVYNETLVIYFSNLQDDSISRTCVENSCNIVRAWHPRLKLSFTTMPPSPQWKYPIFLMNSISPPVLLYLYCDERRDKRWNIAWAQGKSWGQSPRDFLWDFLWFFFMANSFWLYQKGNADTNCCHYNLSPMFITA